MRLFTLLLLLTVSVSAKYKFIAADTGTKEVFIVDENGKKVWTYKSPGKPEDVSFLKNGNILLCTKNKVMEMTMDKKVVFEFSRTGELHSAQRLADGNTLIGHTSEGKVYLVSPKGEVIKEVKTTYETKNKHRIFRRIRQTEEGKIYAAHHGDGVCRVYDQSGKVLNTLKHYSDRCFSATPLTNDRVLLTGLDKVKIVNLKNEVLWEIDIKEIPDSKVLSLTSAKMLENGNILVTNWMGHHRKLIKKKGYPSIVEISPEKKVVWQYDGGKNKCLIALDVAK